MRPLEPGDPERVGGYRLLGRLGAGGMGVVYCGRSPGGRTVAVKVVHERFAADPEFRARFRREVAAARLVTGACTAVVLDAGLDDDAPWLVTAYLPGMTVREAVTAVGALPPQTLRVLAGALAEALVDIHRAGLVHRDLKPGNIMLLADGVRVIDFGIARPDDATAITRVGAVVGTPGFMSPEQISGGVVGPASDVFSLGSVLMFAATGREPFGRGPGAAARVLRVATDLDAVADPWLRDLVGACLRKDPAARPTAVDLVDRVDDGTPDAGWLPAELAQEIDHRMSEGPRPTDRADGEPVAGMADPTVDPTVDPSAQHGAGVGRRLVLAGGVVATVAAVVGAVAMGRGGSRPVGSVAPSGPAPSGPTSGGSTPPEAVVRWRAKVSDYYPRQLSVARGVVVARTPEDELHALDAETGRPLWTHPASLVGTAAGDAVFEAQNTNPRLAMLDAPSGAPRWSHPVPVSDLPLRLAADGSLVCYGFQRVRALSVQDGRSRWSADVDAGRGLALVGGVVAAAGDTGVVGLDASSGRVLWRFPADVALYLAGGTGLVFVVDRTGALFALRADDGVTAWEKRTFGGVCAPWQDGAALYASGGNGEVFALDPASGRQLWSRRLDHDSDLEVSGGTVLAVTTANTLHGLRAGDGRPLWIVSADVMPQPVLNAPPVTSAGGRFFVGVREGFVVSLAGPDGGAREGP